MDTTLRTKRRKDRGQCVVCAKPALLKKGGGFLSQCAACKEKNRERQKIRRNPRRLWKLFFEKYGTKCICCGESRLEFLTVEHLDGPDTDMNGNRISSGRSLQKIVFGEKRDDIAVLCFNCNCVQQRTGECPHTNNGEIWP